MFDGIILLKSQNRGAANVISQDKSYNRITLEGEFQENSAY